MRAVYGVQEDFERLRHFRKEGDKIGAIRLLRAGRSRINNFYSMMNENGQAGERQRRRSATPM